MRHAALARSSFWCCSVELWNCGLRGLINHRMTSRLVARFKSSCS